MSLRAHGVSAARERAITATSPTVYHRSGSSLDGHERCRGLARDDTRWYASQIEVLFAGQACKMRYLAAAASIAVSAGLYLRSISASSLQRQAVVTARC